MLNFLVGLLVVLVIGIACLGGLMLYGVIMIFGVALISLLKVLVVICAVVFVIWLIGKFARGLFGAR